MYVCFLFNCLFIYFCLFYTEEWRVKMKTVNWVDVSFTFRSTDGWVLCCLSEHYWLFSMFVVSACVLVVGCSACMWYQCVCVYTLWLVLISKCSNITILTSNLFVLLQQNCSRTGCFWMTDLLKSVLGGISLFSLIFSWL